MKKTISYLTMTATILFFITLIMAFICPEALDILKLQFVEASVIVMTLISLILLLNFMQVNISLPWRIFCLIASFIVLIESILMLGAWQQMIR